MLKAVAWGNTLYILGPNTNISVGAGGVTISGMQVGDFLNFKESAALMERLGKDEAFRNVLQALVGSIFVRFLNQPNMAVLDLAASLLNAKIQADPNQNGLVENPV